MGGQKQPTTAEKALQINLDPSRHGTFAEIGAEQEIVRWFLRAGGVDGLIAKSSPILTCRRSACEADAVGTNTGRSAWCKGCLNIPPSGSDLDAAMKTRYIFAALLTDSGRKMINPRGGAELNC